MMKHRIQSEVWKMREAMKVMIISKLNRKKETKEKKKVMIILIWKTILRIIRVSPTMTNRPIFIFPDSQLDLHHPIRM